MIVSVVGITLALPVFGILGLADSVLADVYLAGHKDVSAAMSLLGRWKLQQPDHRVLRRFPPDLADRGNRLRGGGVEVRQPAKMGRRPGRGGLCAQHDVQPGRGMGRSSLPRHRRRLAGWKRQPS